MLGVSSPKSTVRKLSICAEGLDSSLGKQASGLPIVSLPNVLDNEGKLILSLFYCGVIVI